MGEGDQECHNSSEENYSLVVGKRERESKQNKMFLVLLSILS